MRYWVLGLAVLGLAGCGAKAPQTVVAAPTPAAEPEAPKFDGPIESRKVEPLVELLEKEITSAAVGSWGGFEAIAKRPEFRPEKLAGWLHEMRAWKKIPPGTYEVPLEGEPPITLSIRVPAGYDPNKKYPLIFSLPPSGSEGRDYLPGLAEYLKELANDFVIVGPNLIGRNYFDTLKPRDYQLKILRQVRKMAHIDSDRVYPVGLSLGGLGAFTWITLSPQEFASAISIAGTLTPIVNEWLLDEMLQSGKHVPILNAYGEIDNMAIYGLGGPKAGPKIWGKLNEVNQKLEKRAKSLGIPVENYVAKGRGHEQVPIPAELIRKYVSFKRVQTPKQIDHAFRFLEQAKPYWIEAITLEEPLWKEGMPEDYDKDPDKALRRVVGHIKATASDNVLKIDTEHVASMWVWITEGLVDWNRPVRVIWNGKPVFAGRIERNPITAMAEARRTWDFERLRWNGIQIEEGKAQLWSEVMAD